MLNPSLWFCCLNEGEQAVLRGIAPAFVLTLGAYCPKVVWDALWLTVLYAREQREAMLMVTWELSVITMDIGDPPSPTDVLVSARPDQLLFLAAWLLTPEGTCPDGCTRFTPP